MGKFKVGDRVTHNAASNVDVERHWNENFRRTQGDIIDGALVIVGVYEWNVGLSNKPGPAFFYMPPDKLKLADPVEWVPKVGERVRWLGKFKSGMYTKGKIYQIHKSTEYSLFVTDDTGSLEHTWSQGELIKNFELVTSLTIEAGKFYKTRDGRRVGPMDEWTSGQFREKAGNGRFWMKSGEGVHEPDLVAEWVDEVVEQPANSSNDNENPVKPNFKVGDRVRAIKSSFGGAVSAGDVYSVTEVTDYGIRFINKRGRKDGWNSENFELVTPATPTNPAIVCLIEDGQPKPSRYPRVHAGEGEASGEAARLAQVYKGQKFGVYVLTQAVSEGQIYAHEWQNLAANGNKIGAIKALRELASLDLLSAKKAVEVFAEKAA